jgi:hypothetical protein
MRKVKRWKRTYNKDKVRGTCYQGTIKSSTAELIKTFGDVVVTHSDKTRIEWCIEFEDKKIATIYDWKESVPVEDVVLFCVGGEDKVVVRRIEKILNFKRYKKM